MIHRRLFCQSVLVVPGFAAFAAAPPEQRRFSSHLPNEKLASLLIPRSQWKPFPTAAERDPWQQLPAAERAAMIAEGESHLKQQWPELPATLFLEYAREGNRSRYEGVRNRRRDALRDLAIAECLEGKGRFLDDLVNGIWVTCEESFWGVPAHIGVQKAGKGLPDVAEPIVDLFAAETSALLAWIHYLLAPQLATVSPLVNPRIALEIESRILQPLREREDFGWVGFQSTGRVNNWNPWINSNWLASALLMESDEARRTATVGKIVRSLDRFLDAYHEDGGCDEGPGYWGRAGASLFDCLEWLYSASNGKIDFYQMPLVGEIGRYIYRAHIYDDWYTNFGDASARTRIAGDLVYRYGKRIGDPRMQSLGALAASGVPRDSIGRQLPALFNLTTIAKAEKGQPLIRDAWLPGTQVMMARIREGSPDGFYMAVQGGHNAESHNHNDVGNFLVFFNGQPVFVDAGVETYSAKTFSSRRYEIWTMQSGWHNLPTIGGHMQQPGETFRATNLHYDTSDAAASLEMDIAQAWGPEAAIRGWKRKLLLDRRANAIALTDTADLGAAQPVSWTFLTPRAGTAGAGEVVLDDVKLLFDGTTLTAKV
jgi:hypothetical protein